MNKNSLLLSALLCQFLLVASCPVQAEDENLTTQQRVDLIPLNASYDTDYKIGAAGSTNVPVSCAPPINMRRIVPIIFENCLDSRSVWVGDQITARLKEDLYYGKNLIAPKNSLLKGRVISCRNARTLSESMLHKEDYFKSSSAIGIQFDQLIVEQGKSIALIGLPAHQESTRLAADGYTYEINVDSQGRIIAAGKTLSKNQKDSYNMLRVATSAPVPGGFLVNIVAGPAVMGAVGAASPDLAFNKPLEPNVSHKRLKGMAYGFFTNLPGVAVVQAVTQKGNEVIVNNGDELMIDLTISDFNNARQNTTVLAVQGQVLEPQQTKVRLIPSNE